MVTVITGMVRELKAFLTNNAAAPLAGLPNALGEGESSKMMAARTEERSRREED